MADTDEDAGSVRLQVASARPEDSGRGIVRLDRPTMERIGVREGDVVEISGKRCTAAIAMPPAPEDEGLTLARLDGLLRGNAGVAAGEQVEVARAELRPAKRVVLAPAQKEMRLHGSGEALRRSFLRRPFAAGDVVSTSVHAPRAQADRRIPEELRRMLDLPAYGLQEIRLVVVSTEPRALVQMTEETEVILRPTYEEPAESRRPDITYDDIGGLGDTVDRIREMVELPLRHPELFQRLGIDPPKGVLLHGPPGTGKTLLARVVANEAEAEFFLVNGPEILGKMQGESEERLRQVFQQAGEQAPAIIFIDEIDSITPKRDQTGGEAERRLVAQLLTLMDGLQPRQNVMVIGATNRIDSLDEALRRPGRFDRELTIGVPDQAGRREVLGIHTRGMPLDEDVDLDGLARVTYGFVGADIAALAREAAMDAVRRLLPEIDLKEEVPARILEDLAVTRADFENALRRVQPSAMREIMIQVPNVSWDDIGGLSEVRETMKESIELPLKDPDAFRRLGIRPAKGFLLYGPPGTGKTLLAKAVAREAEANFIATKSSDLLSKWYGESEQQVARLFRRARQVAPTVIFIDEIDSLAPVRGGGLGEPAVTERVVNTILSEMDGLEELQGVVVIGATNRPNLVDPALLRPGRFDELIYVPVPDLGARRRILEIRAKDMPLGEDVDLDDVAKRTERYTGADLEDVVRRAGLVALRKGDARVDRAAFDAALQESRASVTPEMEKEYESLRASLGREDPFEQSIGFRLPKGGREETEPREAAEARRRG
ncbi:CDC48 family AAA ATPase [Rhodosalinus sp.]|uniref:CDC48 family AAA ATPase n=1 Tax=Rhodosalinus sp. TaxID=2047741 RepID=UPI003568FCF5